MTHLLVDALGRIAKLTHEEQDFAALLLMRYIACTKIESFRKLDPSQLNERMEKLIAELSEGK
jgi:hypothetical protein